MIARMWRGWTNAENGDSYERVFKRLVLPELDAVEGCKQAYLFRRKLGDEEEFIVLTMFESVSAVQAFAGEHYETAVISSEAREVLKRFDEYATHYELVVSQNQ